MLTHTYPRVCLAHVPTPLEAMPNLSQQLRGPRLWVKRDDCTGLALGGNKARQLEFYLGDALAQGADTVLTTGAVQSNHVRMTVAAARKLGLAVEVQLEDRVPHKGPEYYQTGNPLLIKLMGATVHRYPVGEDEGGADVALEERAAVLRQGGAKPYVIPLSGDHTPLGALGYVVCAQELLDQAKAMDMGIDAVALASGSASTHAGLLAGLRALGCDIPVYGFCVRRARELQRERVYRRACQVATMVGHGGVVGPDDVWVDDSTLAPGYGQLNPATVEAIQLAARWEGLLLDPVYNGKSLAGLIQLVEGGRFAPHHQVVFLHTGGAPALFSYPELMTLPANP